MLPTLLALGFQLVVAVGGLLLPGSIVAYPYSIDESEPITVVYGFPGGRLVVFATLVLLSAGFLVSLRTAARLPFRHTIAIVLAAAIPLVGAFVLAYPTGSTDVFQNMADARTLWTYHQWPMTTPPTAHPQDPVIRHMPPSRDIVSKYGPLSYISAGIPAGLGGDDFLETFVWFKLFNGVLLLVLAAVVGWAAHVLSPGREAEATAMVAWNPLLLFEAVGNAHNDVLMAVFMVLALVLAARRLGVASLFALAVGAGVKFVTVLLAPLTWAWLWLIGDRRERTILAALGLAAVVVALAGYALLGDAFLGGRGPAAGQGVVGSPISVIFYALEPWLGLGGIPIARGVCFIAFGVLTLGLLGRVRRSPLSLWRTWVWVLVGLVVLTATQVYPWYLMWVIPLAAIVPGTKESDVAVIATIAGLVSYAFWPWQPVEIVNGELHPNALYNFVFVLAFFGGPATYLMLARRFRLPTTATLLGGRSLLRDDAVEALLPSPQDDRAIL